MLDEKEPLASFENLRVEFDTKDGKVVAVEDISFEIKPKQTVCLVGESGSGKSVSSLSMILGSRSVWKFFESFIFFGTTSAVINDGQNPLRQE